MDKMLNKFLENQKAAAISIIDGKNVWPFNIYYAHESNKMYFVSNKDTKHSKLTTKEGIPCSVSIIWYDDKNLEDRKAIQAQGTLKELDGVIETLKGMQILDKKYPDWKFDLNNVKDFILKKAIYEVEISYIKYWDDVQLGEETIKEYNFYK